jgi:septal ring factor EnvC (AmiA/AmiB activator)
MNASTYLHKEKHQQAGSAVGVLLVIIGLAIVVILLAIKFHRLDAKSAPASPGTQGVPAADSQAQKSAQAKPDLAQAQADLDRAVAATAQLQAQLDKAKSVQADLQSQLDQSRNAGTQLQSRLDSAKAESADRQSQLDKAKAQAEDLRSQITQAAAEKSRLVAQLDQATKQSADLQARLQKSEGYVAQIQPLLVRARHLPVRTSLEKVRGSPFELVNGRTSFTLHINNPFLEPLSVDLTIVHGGRTVSQTNTIAGGATLNLEKLAVGDKVTIGGDQYEPVNVTME